MIGAARESFVLGFHPTSHGFGWIAFSAPFSIHDWGIADVRASEGDKNAQCLRKLDELLDRLNPHTLVLEAFEGASVVKRSRRVVRLCRATVAAAQGRSIDVGLYGRGDILGCFAAIGAKTRHEVAASIARSFDMLARYLPTPRQPWQGPHRRMALFDAAAVVLAHYQLGASRLLDDLSGAS